MKKLASIVPDAIAREEVLRAARAAKVMRRWAEVVGPLLAAKSAPDKYDHGTVWVATTGSAWAQELRMIKGQILSKLNAESHESGLFTDIRFGVRPITNAVVENDEIDDRRAQHREKLRELSIAEIRDRRMKQRGHEGRD